MTTAASKLSLFLSDEEASKDWARGLARRLSAPLTLSFSGEIGAGKTTIIRAILTALGVDCVIKSPTFSLVETYTCSDLILHHFDLYRIHHEEELEYIGFRDFFSERSICFIEWAERAGKLLPAVDLSFKLSVNEAGRELEMRAWSLLGQDVLAGPSGE